MKTTNNLSIYCCMSAFSNLPSPRKQVLIMAMAVSFGIQSWIEGGVITAVIVINIVVGFMQEFSAEKTMDSLRSLSSPTAQVVRNGNTVTIPTAEIVPGGMTSKIQEHGSYLANKKIFLQM